MILYEEKDYKESIEVYNEAIKLNPIKSIYYSEKGLCYFQLGLINESIEEFDKAISLQPYNTHYYYYKSIVLFEQKRYIETIEALNQSISINQYIHKDNQFLDLK